MKPILPNQDWLKANGYEGMAEAMKTNPELFAYIKQEAAENTGKK